ncbi:PIN domain-containing protein [Deinococcus sp. QL22]|uniref:PIN domain-containing protein n=1 Tax=Deinococcus sp. QL22 TaxID=2939437 RepID=UPI0020182CCC|nr:PIN domain-containing protein [Deinococcus sp. QL22]UQN10816.1 PIN domain-containing protein [Deinococcus sp. QL22]
MRDLLIRLDIEGLCRLRWSDEVNHEWINALIRDRGFEPEPLLRTQALMDRALPHARVTGFSHLIPELKLPDPDDRHVLAAALHSRVAHLITFNRSDFPDHALPSAAPQVVHPDAWLAPVLSQDLQLTCRVLRQLVAPFRKPPRSISDVAGQLAQILMPQSAQVLEEMVAQGIC